MYNIGQEIEFVDPIDNSVNKGQIVFIENFYDTLLVYVRCEEESMNMYTDDRFPGKYGKIICDREITVY